MRLIEVDGRIFVVPAAWSRWTTKEPGFIEHVREFHRRSDGTIWSRVRGLRGENGWRCVSPGVLPSEVA